MHIYQVVDFFRSMGRFNMHSDVTEFFDICRNEQPELNMHTKNSMPTPKNNIVGNTSSFNTLKPWMKLFDALLKWLLSYIIS